MARACVLIVDDEPAFLRTVATAVRVLGFDTLCAPNGPAALGLVRSTRPDVVLADVRMPGLTGIELARMVKQDAELAGTTVLLMSGFGRPGSHVADGFLAKPFSIDELSELLEPHVPKP